MKQTLAVVVSNTEIMPGVNLMWIEAPDIAMAAQPGQFITIYCEGSILRRPFSIHQVATPSRAKQSQVAVLFRVVGEGTLWLSQRQAGDKIDILGPLGKGFSIKSTSRNLLLLAGGIGIAPLLFLAQRAALQHSITLIHGASTANQLYPSSLKGGSGKPDHPRTLPESVQFIPVTEDASMGVRGMITDIVPDFLDWADQVFACGPLCMYQALAVLLNGSSSKAEERDADKIQRQESKLKKCQVSLEVRLGCGIGACYGCTIRTKTGAKQVCQDGPVFEMDDIIWEEVKI